MCFKDASPECIPAKENSVAICLRSYHIFTGLLVVNLGTFLMNSLSFCVYNLYIHLFCVMTFSDGCTYVTVILHSNGPT